MANNTQTEEEAIYEYWAFISHSNKDGAWAKWLQTALENYRLPTHLSRHLTPTGEPVTKRLKPIFLDRADMEASNNLRERIERNLKTSRFLIVICSPNAVQSPWVGEEIEAFRAIHGNERILSVIVGGLPDSDGADNCFPAPLRNPQPMAPDVRIAGGGKNNAKLRIIAAMLGVRYDVLKQRDKERRRKMAGALCLAMLPVLAFMGWLAWKTLVAQDQVAKWVREFLIAKDSAAKSAEGKLVAQNETAIEKARREKLSLTKSRDDHQAALRAFGENRYGDGLAYFERALNLVPNNASAFAASAAYTFGPSAPYWRLRSIFPAGSAIISALFSPDGRHLAIGTKDGDLLLIETATNTEVGRLKFEGSVEKVCFSPDGRFAAGCTRTDTRESGTQGTAGTVRLMEVEGGKLVGSLTIRGGIDSLVFGMDGRRLYAGSSEIRMMEVTSGKDIGIFSFGNEYSAEAMCSSADGSMLAAGCSNKLVVVDAATGAEIHHLDFGMSKVVTVSFSPDGRFVAGGSYGSPGKASVMEVSTGNLINTRDFGVRVSKVVFSPEGSRLAVGSWDRNVVVMNPFTNKDLGEVKFDGFAQSVGFSSDGHYVAGGSWDGTLTVMETNSGKLSCSHKFDGKVNTVNFSPDERFLAASSDDHTLRIFEASGGKNVAVTRFADRVSAISYSPDGRYLATGVDDKTVRISEIASGREIQKFDFKDNIAFVCFSPDGHFFAAGAGSNDKSAKVFDTLNWKETCRLYFKNRVTAGTFIADTGLFAAGSDDRTVQIVEAATDKRVKTFEFDTNVHCLTASPNGRYIAIGDEGGTLWIKGALSGENISNRKFHFQDGFGQSVGPLGFSPDSSYIIAGSNGRALRMIEPSSGSDVGAFTTDEGGYLSLSFTPDERYLVTSWQSYGVQVFDRATQAKVARLRLGNDFVSSTSFSKDGRFLAVGCWDKTIRTLDWNWMQPSDEEASKGWLHAIRLQGGLFFDSPGNLQPAQSNDLLEDQKFVNSYIAAAPPENNQWQHTVIKWSKMQPELRTTSPWTNEPMRVAAGQWLMSIDTNLNRYAGSIPVKSLTSELADQAPWHPLEPVSLARFEAEPEDKTGAYTSEAILSRRRFLARLTLKRLRDADEKLYGRQTLAEYAAWAAKIMHEELHFDSEALEALDFALDRTPSSESKELLKLKSELPTPKATSSNSGKASLPAALPEASAAKLALQRGLELQSGAERNPVEAAAYFQKAADLGDEEAQYQLAIKYMLGSGVKQDYAKAVGFAQKSASRGNINANYLLGNCYFMGQGVDRNLSRAKSFFEVVAAKGEDSLQYNAQYRLKEIQKALGNAPPKK